MSRRGLLFPVLVSLALLIPLSTGAQEEGAQGMPPVGPPEEMQQIAGLEGVWNVKFEYKMDPMAEEWTASEGLATIKNVLDGAAQQMDYSGEIMGMKFSGVGSTCYDRETKTWQNSWIDNMGARLSLYTGEMTDGKLVFTGKDMSQGMSFHSRQTMFNITENSWEWTMEMSMDGEIYTPIGKAVYTRR